MATSDELPSELNALIETISSSLANTTSCLPTTVPDAPNGLSLLTLKNNLLLSYLQNLSLLTISKLSHPELTLQTPESQSIIWNLIQDRVHLEKGVQPLETKIGYQIRKLLRAADTSATNTTPSGEKDGSLLFKPNPSALVSANPVDNTDPSEAIYRPPKISSTALPTARAEGPRRNKVLEEFIAQTELSNAPTPLPSIGSNLAGIGARNTYKTTRHKDVEQYEEENFIRLPSNIMKEKKGRKERGGMQEFGGEDWSGLQRIGMGKWDFGKREGKVERSRKRGFEEGFGGRGEEVTGQAFEKRKKLLEGRKMKKQKGAKR